MSTQVVCVCMCVFPLFFLFLSWSLSTVSQQSANLPVFPQVMLPSLPNRLGEEMGKKVTPTENLLSPVKPQEIQLCVWSAFGKDSASPM